MIKKMVYCDGPINRYAGNHEAMKGGCPTHAPLGVAEWITIRQAAHEEHFCSWDCVLARASKSEPNEIVR
jgi:hypothetical protein